MCILTESKFDSIQYQYNKYKILSIKITFQNLATVYTCCICNVACHEHDVHKQPLKLLVNIVYSSALTIQFKKSKMRTNTEDWALLHFYTLKLQDVTTIPS